MSTNITETRELTRALSAFGLRLSATLADKKASWLELASFIQDWNVYADGLRGVELVPKELADLDETERDVLIAEIGAYLTQSRLRVRTVEAAERVLKWVFDTVEMALFLKNQPPAAEPVP